MIFGLQVWRYASFMCLTPNHLPSAPESVCYRYAASVRGLAFRLLCRWCLFHLYEYGVCHDVGCTIGADAVHSGGVVLHDYESTAFYKLSLAIFSVLFDVASFALTILIFALATTSSPAFPEQALATVNSDPVSTVLVFSPSCWPVISIHCFVIAPASITLNFT